MSEQNKALARRWFEEVWNQGSESAIDELLHPQGKAYGFPDPDSVLIGPEGSSRERDLYVIEQWSSGCDIDSRSGPHRNG